MKGKKRQRQEQYFKCFAFILTAFLILAAVFGMPEITEAAQRKAAQASQASMKFEYAGKLGDILRTLMAQYGKNIVFGDDVAGIPISLQIEASDFEDLLYMIEIAANVEVTEAGKNSYTVKTLAEAQRIRDFQNLEKDRSAQAERIAREMEGERKRVFDETVERLGNTVVRMFDVKFIAVEDLEKAFGELLGDDFKNFVRVKSLSNDSNRNYSTILVSAPSQYIIDKVADLIKTIDREKPMIEIEALFVEVSLNNQKGLGLDWSIFPEAVQYTEVPAILETTLGDLYNARRPNSFIRTSALNVSAQLKQLAESGKGKVLSNTKIRTMSGRKSYFTSEVQEPIMSLNGDGEVRVEYKNVGISLESIATVLDDNSIYMKVIPRSSTITGEKTLRDSTAPQISERRVEAEVILNPDETMVISGLMYDRDSITKARVPVLSAIPLIGELFKSSERRTERFQVFIYLRPRLVDISARADSDPATSGREISDIWTHYSKQNINNVMNSFDTGETGGAKKDSPDPRTSRPDRLYTSQEVDSRFREIAKYYEIPETYP